MPQAISSPSLTEHADMCRNFCGSWCPTGHKQQNLEELDPRERCNLPSMKVVLLCVADPVRDVAVLTAVTVSGYTLSIVTRQLAAIITQTTETLKLLTQSPQSHCKSSGPHTYPPSHACPARRSTLLREPSVFWLRHLRSLASVLPSWVLLTVEQKKQEGIPARRRETSGTCFQSMI